MDSALEQINRILITVMDRLGDVTNTTPALRAIRSGYPNARVTVEAHPDSVELLQGSNLCDVVWLRGRRHGRFGRLRRLRRMRRGSFDAAFLLDCDSAAMVLAWLCGIPRRYGAMKDRHARLCTLFEGRLPARHEVRDPLERLLRRVGVASAVPAPALHVEAAAERSVAALLDRAGCAAGDPVVGLVVGGSSSDREWPRERWIEAASRIMQWPATAVIVGGPAETAAASEIRSRSPGAIDTTGQLSVAEAAALLARCSAVLAGDTGPMHMATALGVPVVALYGPTDPVVTGPADLSRCRIVRAADGTMRGIGIDEAMEALDMIMMSGEERQHA